MFEEIYSHDLVKPLLTTGPGVPKKEIEQLAEAIRKSKSLGRKCNQLFRFETTFSSAPSSYVLIWVAFALALAKDDDAINTLIDLFELVDPMEHDILWELAQFTLWQYGDDAVRHVLSDFWRVIDIDHTGYYLGVLEVVGLSHDQLLRRRVANAIMEALESPKTSPAALMGLVDIAIILEEPRLPEVLSRWKDQVTPEEQHVLAEAEQVLLGADPELRNDEYKLPWYDLAEFSADHFSIHLNEPSPMSMTEPDSESLNTEFTALAESFRRSSNFLDIPEQWRHDPQQMIQLLIDIFRLLFSDLGTLPDEADAEEVATLMREVLPRKMVGDVAAFEPIPSLLTSFFRYITDSYSVDEGDEFEFRIQSSITEMLERAANPIYWDWEKAQAMEKS